MVSALDNVTKPRELYIGNRHDLKKAPHLSHPQSLAHQNDDFDIFKGGTESHQKTLQMFVITPLSAGHYCDRSGQYPIRTDYAT